MVQASRYETAGVPAVELALIAEHLDQMPLDILQVKAHENCHHIAVDRGIKDCSKSGRHSKAFMALGVEMGLSFHLDGEGKPLSKSRGYADTFLSPELENRIVEQFQPRPEAFQVFRREIPTPKKPGTPKWECPNCVDESGTHPSFRAKADSNWLCGVCMAQAVVVPPK